jgi:hypothetical protein
VHGLGGRLRYGWGVRGIAERRGEMSNSISVGVYNPTIIDIIASATLAVSYGTFAMVARTCSRTTTAIMLRAFFCLAVVVTSDFAQSTKLDDS